MSESLALETQLLLQEVTQATQLEVSLVDANQAPVSELEAAKRSLLDKLKQKKEQNKQKHQQVYAQRYGIELISNKQEVTPVTEPAKPSGATGRLTPVKAKRMVKLPVAAAGSVASRQKKEMLSNLRTQAIKQGAQDMAKFFGYSSYEEQIAKLNASEKKKMRERERMEKLAQAAIATNATAIDVEDKDEDSSSDFAPENSGEIDGGAEVENDGEEEAADKSSTDLVPAENDGAVDGLTQPDASHSQDIEETQDLEALEAPATDSVVSVVSPSLKPSSAYTVDKIGNSETTHRRRNRVTMDEDDDGNEADSEEDGKDDEEEAVEDDEEEGQEKANKDRAAAYRQMLQAEAMQNRKLRRLRKGANFVESEAEEEEEEDVLRIGGLGDFGFGVPQAATKESKEAEEERNALKLREDDLEGIVDDLSDDERAQEQDLEEIHRRELEEQDRQQVKEVMRNVKEGFGRNRRAFSGLAGAGARGRFNLDELVAADGDKLEAARLGLLESDEEMNDDGDDENESKEQNENEEEEDEEAEMERRLRERYLNQPKIYITSSESEDEGEEEAKDDDDEGVKEEIESDEERERQQMKQFSERARINRRMQRMKDLQRQIAEETEQDSTTKAPLPNILLEEDEESESLLKVLNRKDVQKPTKEVDTRAKEVPRSKPTAPSSRPRVGRFGSFGMGSGVRSTSSFSRVVDNVKLFNAGSTTGTTKGFVFTSFSSDRTANVDENATPGADDSEMTEAAALPKQSTKPRNTTKRPFATVNGARAPPTGASKKRKSDFFSVLASYQPDQQ